jgi:hypothetical protein
MARSRIPREVLERARAQATRVSEGPPAASKNVPRNAAVPEPSPRAGGKRDKIVHALRKLHPMD